MKPKTELDIIIPTYNGSKHIQGILRSIKKQTFQGYRCFVIDDCSTDRTVDIIKKKFPWVKIIRQKSNNGPAKNRNIAIQKGNSPYIAIFDDDTFLDDTNWFEAALKIMKENNSIGQIASMVISGFNKNIVLDCGIALTGYLFGGRYYNHKLRHLPKKCKASQRVLGACTAGTIMRRDVFEKVGGFDEKYYYLAEDVELSLRIHLAGYDVVFMPFLRTYHLESQAMGKDIDRKWYLLRRNSIMAIAENMPIIFILKILLKIVLREIVLRSAIYFLLTKIKKRKLNFPPEARHYMETLRYLKKNFLYVINKRWNFNKVRTRSRYYLLKI